MPQLDAIRLADNLRDRMVEFALDDNFVRDGELARVCRRLWNGAPADGGLVSDLWVEGAFPSKPSECTLGGLANAGDFSPDLRGVLAAASAMPADRPLYTHQVEAMQAAGEGADDERPAIVVSAGTGAGKTEAFLLPILDDLYRNPPEERNGVQCLILYPMNALVNDQVDRLYGWLKDQTCVSLFHFTSETPENWHAADRQDVPKWERCRMRTRQQARGFEDRDGQKTESGPTPDILITNYSMLEYMLCRPQDAGFFGSSLRTVVLDEAHLYTGTLAAEITLLLRRLALRCGLRSERITHFATSATLGSGDSGELSKFASEIFSKPRRLVRVIYGEQTKEDLPPPEPPASEPSAETVASTDLPDYPTIVESAGGVQTLAEIDNAQRQRLTDALSPLTSENVIAGIPAGERRPAAILHGALAKSPLIHELQGELWDKKHVRLDKLGAALFGGASRRSAQAAAALLRLAASARTEPNSYPLVPHRLHLLTRPTDGVTVCLNDNCPSAYKWRSQGLGAVAAGYRDVCEHCDCAALALYRCQNCGECLLAGREIDGKIIAETRKTPQTQLFSIRRADSEWDTVLIDRTTGERRGSGASGALALDKHSECPNCEESRDRIRPFYSGTPLTLSIAAETLLAEMPEFPASGQGSREWLPAGGRRLLAFSDSRREAARLGVSLTYQHELQVLRHAILDVIENSPLADKDAIDDVQSEISEIENSLANPALSPAVRRRRENRLTQLRQELRDLTAGGSIEDWANELANQDALAQILDRPSSENHVAPSWKQLKWEDNHKAVKARAKEFLKRELATSVGRDDTLEALGLVEVTYPGLDQIQPPSEFVGTLPTEIMRRRLSDNWSAMLASLCDTLRASRVVTLGDELDEEYDSDGGVPIGFWATKTNDDGFRLARFVGRSDRQIRLRFAAEILKQCGFPDGPTIEDVAKELLDACFDQLAAGLDGSLRWIENSNRQVAGGGSVPAIRIVFDNLGLRRPPNLFRCETTGRIWNRSVLGSAPNMGTFGTLKPVSHDQMDADPRHGRRRREYRDSRIFEMGLWSEEHSAQLAPRENRRLQDLFKSGVRNMLSSTTTLELGIDIGGLSGALMSNVPPGKSNYLQRAGRAGRRADGSSIVATFARPRPFDREVFVRMDDYLAQDLRKPMALLDRERVVMRHLNSFLLNSFFSPATSGGRTGAMDAFGNMGVVCGVPYAQYWRDRTKPEAEQRLPDGAKSAADRFVEFLGEIEQSPSLYKPSVERLLGGTVLKNAASDWENLISSVSRQFQDAVEDWRKDYDDTFSAWQEVPASSNAQNRRQANAIGYQLRALYETTVIEALADRQFLPRYGFPIGVQKLRVISQDEDRADRIREEDRYRLERGSLLALREYVPGSQILAGGKLVSSRGLLKHWTGIEIDNYIGLRGNYVHCVNDHFHYWTSPETTRICPICGEGPQKSPTRFMFPRHGFSGAAWDPPKWSSSVELVGEAQTAAQAFIYADGEDVIPNKRDFGGVPGLSAYYKEDGELLVYNAGEREIGFAICLKCGYADSEKDKGDGRVNLPTGFDYHARLSAPRNEPIFRCWRQNEAPVIRNETLAAREVTDVLLMDFSEPLAEDMADRTLVATLGYALQRAAAKILQLDGREIGVLTVPAGENGRGLGAMLYDNVPGGAGHVRELLEYGRRWLEEARGILYINETHDKRCQTACLDCLLSFDTQSASSVGLLSRPRAYAALSRMLNGEPPPAAPEPTAKASAANPSIRTQSASKEERLRRARARKSR